MPVPLVAYPDTPAVAVAVQAKVVPITLEFRVTKEVFPPEQIVCDNGKLVTVGVGFTDTVTVKILPVQVPDFGVTL
ncbi:hypothetical protein AB3G34_09340 [Flavobacterium sp. WC2409]|uniref:Uncharacterized protein n=1 Tax=Flavobacterium sp. WC2409 TaxID=3234139 RepID=A0AB39VX37_9FLAO